MATSPDRELSTRKWNTGHLLAGKPNLETFSIYSNKFFHNCHLSESSFTCLGLHTSGLVWRLLDERYRLRQVSRLISGVIISLYLRTVQQCRLNAWACWAVALGPMLIYVCCDGMHMVNCIPNICTSSWIWLWL